MTLDDVTTTPVFRFETPGSVASWEAVDDRVMGGLSSSRLVHLGSGGARFTGLVSTAQGGGFASVRSGPLPVGLDGMSGLLLVVSGDGRTYKACARTDLAFDGVLYQARFAPPEGKRVEVRLPFTAFVPTRRGRVVEAPPLTGDRVQVIGLMVSDKQAGPFALDVERIEAFR
jgi:NADH dehydrogenase [ubiquinone] 1 alpha subcomplex assembly factor 1